MHTMVHERTRSTHRPHAGHTQVARREKNNPEAMIQDFVFSSPGCPTMATSSEATMQTVPSNPPVVLVSSPDQYNLPRLNEQYASEDWKTITRHLRSSLGAAFKKPLWKLVHKFLRKEDQTRLSSAEMKKLRAGVLVAEHVSFWAISQLCGADIVIAYKGTCYEFAFTAQVFSCKLFLQLAEPEYSGYVAVPYHTLSLFPKQPWFRSHGSVFYSDTLENIATDSRRVIKRARCGRGTSYLIDLLPTQEELGSDFGIKHVYMVPEPRSDEPFLCNSIAPTIKLAFREAGKEATIVHPTGAMVNIAEELFFERLAWLSVIVSSHPVEFSVVVEWISKTQLAPPTLVSVSQIPYHSLIQADSTFYSYFGYTAGGSLALLPTDREGHLIPSANGLTLPYSRFFALNVGYSPPDQTKPMPCLGVEERWQNVAIQLRWSVITTTIRGIPLIELMSFLHDGCGIERNIAIVGGAIRDAYDGRPVNDIDLVICAPWGALERDIASFFQLKGLPLTSDVLKRGSIRKKFGMMKIVQQVGQHESDIDIGLFKSHHVSSLLGTMEEDGSEFLFGNSYYRDAEFRDYSINAIYYDVFSDSFYDPRGGMADLKAGKFGFAALEDSTKRRDIGGRFRLFKLLQRNQLAPKPRVVSEACNYLLDEVTMFLAEDAFRESESTREKAEYWLSKMAKKLFVGKSASSVVETLRTLIDSIPVDDNGREVALQWFALTCELCKKTQQMHVPLFSGYTSDDPEHRVVWEMVCALAIVAAEFDS